MTEPWRDQAKAALREIIARCYAALTDSPTRAALAAYCDEIARMCMSLKARLEDEA